MAGLIQFDATTTGYVQLTPITASMGNRVQNLQDAAGTIALLSGSQTWTGTQDFSGATLVFGTAGTNAVPSGNLSPSMRALDALVQPKIKSATTTAQPGSPADGDTYIVPSGATGAAWSTQVGKIARYSTVAAAWEFYTPQNGWETYAQDTGIYWFRVAGAWTAQLKIGNGTASTSTTTGDLVVAGGGGFGGAIYAPQIIIASGVNQNAVTGGFAYGVGGGSEGIRFSIATGTTYDLTIVNPANSAYILQVPTGTINGIWFGKWTLDGSSGKSLAYTNPTANGSVATTLGSVGPTGSTAGNPQGWMRVNIGGTDRFVPFW